MAGLRKRYARLRLKVNDAKSTVASALGGKFLGYSLWQGLGATSEHAARNRWECAALVAQQPLRVESNYAYQLLRPARCAATLVTSTSRTARCGPACRVVWEGIGQVS